MGVFLFEFVFDVGYKVLRQSVADICNAQERGVGIITVRGGGYHPVTNAINH